MVQIYLAINSGTGDKGAKLQRALTDLERWGVKILMTSKIYESMPAKASAASYNLAARGETSLQLEDLIKAISAVELTLGKQNDQKNEPFNICVDLLFYGDIVTDMAGLKIPYPRIADKKRILMPMDEIAPKFMHPTLKKTMRNLLKECGDKAIVKPL
jgi:2-amino-4-hydroxy-6-hydroxymethyldihydropteridine diphosphokinase